jgi:class 3 adenylate cyclase/streptogramin lyase
VSELPRGTVTLLFTDVEGSTQLQHRLGAASYQQVVAEHRRLLEAAFAMHAGVVVDRQTESFFVVFTRARDAIHAAADAQRAITEHVWPEGARVSVRMGIHSGDPEVASDRYIGLAVSRAARVSACAHGGQVLLSSSARALLSDHDRSDLKSLGSYRLKDFDEPEPISQLVIDGLPSQFPPLRTEAASSRRRHLPFVAFGLLLAAVVAVAAVIAFRGGGAVKVGPTSLAIVDPKTNKVTGAVDLGFKSNLIAAGEGYIWAVDPKGSTLSRLDPRTHTLESFGIAVGAGSIPFGVAAGQGGVWVAVLRGAQEVILELGPEVGDLRKTIHYGASAQSPELFRFQPLTVGDGAVWAIDPAVGGIWRIDPATGRARKLADGLDALSLAAGGGAVWVAGSTGVTTLDSTTGAQLASTPIGSQSVSETASVALGSNAAWYTASSGHTLSKLDQQSGSPTQTFPVGNGPSGVAVGEGAVWVANSADGTLSRIDPRGGKTQIVSTGQTPGGVVAAYGSVWTSPGEPRS